MNRIYWKQWKVYYKDTWKNFKPQDFLCEKYNYYWDKMYNWFLSEGKMFIKENMFFLKKNNQGK